MNRLKKGVILYEGISKIDGAPIVVIATKRSRNVKTGNMIQTWIIRTDMSPVDAIKTGCDSSICGDCPHRGQNGKKRSCYVKVFKAPASVYRCYKRGGYEFLNSFDYAAYFNGYHLRIGSYGDPAVISSYLWLTWCSYSDGNTGYTHQWRKAYGDGFKGIVQASCDNIADYKEATSLGWNTFRVTTTLEKKAADEVVCLNTSLGLTCEKCGLCNGKRKNVVIEVHGQGKRNFKD